MEEERDSEYEDVKKMCSEQLSQVCTREGGAIQG